MSKLAVFLIRVATDPEARDQFRNTKTRTALIKKFSDKNALSQADIAALEGNDLADILGSIAASNQQTDGTAVRVPPRKKRKPLKKKAGKKK